MNIKHGRDFILSTSRRLLPLGLTVLLAVGCGCSALGYRLGSSLPPGVESVYVPVVENVTSEPLLEQSATQALIGEIQREGTLRVAEAARADVILYVTLREFSLEPLRFDRDTATGTREYRLMVKADWLLVNEKTGETVVSRSGKGETDFVLTGDLSSEKRDAIPRAMTDLAHHVVMSIVEFW